MLIETDAPDQMLPEVRGVICGVHSSVGIATVYSLTDATGKALNHPANLAAVYTFAAGLFGETLESLAARVERNFLRLFGEL